MTWYFSTRSSVCQPQRSPEKASLSPSREQAVVKLPVVEPIAPAAAPDEERRLIHALHATSQRTALAFPTGSPAPPTRSPARPSRKPGSPSWPGPSPAGRREPPPGEVFIFAAGLNDIAHDRGLDLVGLEPGALDGGDLWRRRRDQVGVHILQRLRQRRRSPCGRVPAKTTERDAMALSPRFVRLHAIRGGRGSAAHIWGLERNWRTSARAQAWRPRSGSNRLRPEAAGLSRPRPGRARRARRRPGPRPTSPRRGQSSTGVPPISQNSVAIARAARPGSARPWPELVLQRLRQRQHVGFVAP